MKLLFFLLTYSYIGVICKSLDYVSPINVIPHHKSDFICRFDEFFLSLKTPELVYKKCMSAKTELSPSTSAREGFNFKLNTCKSKSFHNLDENTIVI